MQKLENICPEEYAMDIERRLGDDHFPWYWNENTVDYDSNTPSTYVNKDFQFTHVFFRDGEFCSSYAELIKPLISFFQIRSGITIKKIHRIKANLTTQISYTDQEIASAIHIDTPKEYLGIKKYVSFVYYVIDSDGETVIHGNDGRKLSVKPSKNSGVWFDSDLFHYPCPPKESKRRIIINFIFEV